MSSRVEKFSSHLSPNPTAGIRIGSFDDFGRRIESWKKFLNDTVPARLTEFKTSPQSTKPQEEYDVIVVGYGAAGSSAALDAADLGKKVLLVDRFDGGGSTRRSGGIYYAGGGTRAQKDSNIHDDTTENMFKYVKQENGGILDDDTIYRFCQESPQTFEWLENRVGVPFKNDEGKTHFYEKKSSYPPSYATLYYSGNETAYPFHENSNPRPRGNRPFGDYLTGNVFFAAFEKQVEAHPNITVQLHTKLVGFVMDGPNKCRGVRFAHLENDVMQNTNVMLHEIGSSCSFLDPSRAIEAQCQQLERKMFETCSTSQTVLAKHGVVVATGGFFFNAEMVSKYASKYQGYLPLGNLGDDGSGIQLCNESAGCQLRSMDRCSAWKFINPPFSFVKGILVNAQGERIGNEDTYGATFADFVIQKHQGKGWLIIDEQLWQEANEDCMNDQVSGLQEDQKMQGLANLYKNRIKAESLQELVEKTKAPQLDKTFREYNAMVNKGAGDHQFGKLDKYLKALDETDSLYAIRLDMTGNKYWPTPCMSLGGVSVEGSTGQAISQANGKPVQSLYCAGRTAVGICSNYYVSGLSLADAVFSGRRAGRHVGNL